MPYYFYFIEKNLFEFEDFMAKTLDCQSVDRNVYAFLLALESKFLVQIVSSQGLSLQRTQMTRSKTAQQTNVKSLKHFFFNSPFFFLLSCTDQQWWCGCRCYLLIDIPISFERTCMMKLSVSVERFNLNIDYGCNLRL